MSSKDQSAPKSDRKFIVKKPITTIPTVGHTFTEADFREIHPLPDNERAAAKLGENYHADLLGRLLADGAIDVAPDDAETAPIPVGPAVLNREAQQSTVVEGLKESASRAQPVAVVPAAPVTPKK